MAQISEIDLVGIDYPGQVFTDNFIYRLNRKPAELTSYPYLVVCKRIEEISTSNTDILMVEDFKKIETRARGYCVSCSQKRWTYYWKMV